MLLRFKPSRLAVGDPGGMNLLANSLSSSRLGAVSRRYGARKRDFNVSVSSNVRAWPSEGGYRCERHIRRCTSVYVSRGFT